MNVATVCCGKIYTELRRMPCRTDFQVDHYHHEVCRQLVIGGVLTGVSLATGGTDTLWLTSWCNSQA